MFYFDYAAATSIDKKVKKAMRFCEDKIFGNPSSLHQFGQLAKQAIENSRQKVAKILNAQPKEIIFTSSATESNNLALLGLARHFKYEIFNNKLQPHIITSKIEHESVLEPCRQLEKEGFRISYLPVDTQGFINLNDLKTSLSPETILVSIMYANNEIGTIQPISEIAKIIHNYKKNKSQKIKSLKSKIKYCPPFFHTDAVQAANFLNLDVKKLGIDLMTLNSSKIYGPKGVGILYKKEGIEIEPLIYGGGQERNFRSGTENVPGIVGLANALELAQKSKDKETKRLTKLRNYLIKEIAEKIPNTILNGPNTETQKHEKANRKNAKKILRQNNKIQNGKILNNQNLVTRDLRLPNNINISFLGIEAEVMIIYLEKYKIYASAGSACSSNILDQSGSYVVLEISDNKRAESAVRFTIGKETQKSDLDFLIKKLKLITKILGSGFPKPLSYKHKSGHNS